MQSKLIDEKLLDKDGNLVEYGYSLSLIKPFNRSEIKKYRFKIKEWDYYYLGNNDYGIALTIADNTYMSLVGISFLDFKEKKEYTKNYIKFFSFGKLKLPNTSKKGNIEVKSNSYHIAFFNDGKIRKLYGYIHNFVKNQDLSFHLNVSETIDNSIVIITPFKKNKHFYYNQKINLLNANGFINFKNKKRLFNNFYGVLDWGRGIWTYKNTWYWSSLSYYENKRLIGFNLGYGFGILDKATENIIFIDNNIIKLDQVTFNIPKNTDSKDDYMGEWIITDDKNILNLTFTPILDRFSDSNILIIRSLQHQVFGHFNGTINYNGEVIEINDKIGFAEKVFNKW